MKAFSASPITVEEDLLPVVAAFKGIVATWQSQPSLQALIPDQKVALITQLQFVVQEAKKTAAGEIPARQQFVVRFFFRFMIGNEKEEGGKEERKEEGRAPSQPPFFPFFPYVVVVRPFRFGRAGSYMDWK